MTHGRSLWVPALLVAWAASLAGAAAQEPIRIGVIAEASSISGSAIPRGAQIAADEINAAGGVEGRRIEIIAYDDHNASADAVRAFQRAVSQDHVVAVIASYISEVVLALEPWSARLKTLLITPGAASDEISRHIHEDYERNKYTFHGYLPSTFIADSICDAAKQMLVEQRHMKTAVVMSEDAAWTRPLDAEYLKCLPKIGLQVLDHVRVSPDTTDFTPIYNQIEAKKPDVIISGIAHVGVQPTVQWHDQQVPIVLFGASSQATSSTFWKDTNGAAEGVIYQSVTAPDAAVTPKSIPFTQAFEKRYGITPSYCGYTANDDVHMLAEAIHRAGSTDPDKLVAAMEQTDYQSTLGQVQFAGRDSPFTHAIKYGPGLIQGLMVQWQRGQQVTVWPAAIAHAQVTFPAFVKQVSN
jgi:branched-chain amino acid transport system substrate-binding protein